MCENITMLLWICLLILTSYCNGIPKPLESTIGEQRKYGASVANDYTKQNDGAGGLNPGQQPLEETLIGQSVQDKDITAQDTGAHDTWDFPFGVEAGVDPNNVISLGSVDSGSVSAIPNDAIEMPSTIGGIMEQYVPAEFTNPGTYANDPVSSYSQTHQGSENNPSKVIEPSNYQQSVDTPQQPKVHDNSVFDITATNFKNGHHQINSLLADQGAAVSLPYVGISKTDLSETPIQTDVHLRNGEHDKSPNAHTVETSGTTRNDNHNHEHLKHGMIRDPKTGEITHIVDPHDGTILPVQHHDFLGGHAIDPHTSELLLALETESFLPTSAPGGSNQEPYVSHEQGPASQNTGNVLDTSQSSSPGFRNNVETLHTHEGAGQSFLNEPESSHLNVKPFVDSGYVDSEVLPGSLPQNMDRIESFASGNTGTDLGPLPHNLHGQDANLPMNNGGVDYTSNKAPYTEPVLKIQSKNSYGQDTGLLPGDAVGSDYSNNVPPINEPVLEPLPEHEQDTLPNNVGSDYSSQTGTNHEPIVDLPPIATNGQNPFLTELALNPIPVGSYTQDSISAKGIDNSFNDKVTSDTERILEPIPKSTYGQTPELPPRHPVLEPLPKEVYGGESSGDIKGSDYSEDPASKTKFALDLLPIEPFGHDMGTNLDKTLSGDYTGNGGSNIESVLEPIPKTSYEQGSKTMTEDNSGNTGIDLHRIVDKIPVESYEQNPIAPLPSQNFGNDYSGSVKSGVHPVVDPLPEEPYTQQQDSYSADKIAKPYTGEETYNARPVPVSVPKSSYGKDPNLPLEHTANNDYSINKVLDLAPVENQMPKETYGKKTNSGIIDHTGDSSSNIEAVLEQLSRGSFGQLPNSDTKSIIGSYSQTSNTEPVVETMSGIDYTPFTDSNNNEQILEPSSLGSYEQDPNLIPSEFASDYTSQESPALEMLPNGPDSNLIPTEFAIDYADPESNPLGDVLPDGPDPNLIPTEFANDYANPESNPLGDLLPDGPYIQDSIPIPQPLPSYGQKTKPKPIHNADNVFTGYMKKDSLPLESYRENLQSPAIDKVSSGYIGSVDPILEPSPKRTYGQGRPNGGITAKQRIDEISGSQPGGIAIHPELLLQDKRDKMYADSSAVSGDIEMISHDASSGYEDPTSVTSGGFISKILPNHEESFLAKNGETGEVRSVKPVSRQYTRGSSISRTKPVRGSKTTNRKSSSYGSRLLQKAKRGSRILKKNIIKTARKISKVLSKRRRRRKLRVQRRKKKQLLRKKKQERRKKQILAAKAKRQRAARQKTKTTKRRRRISRRRKYSSVQSKESDDRRTYANTRRRYLNRRRRRSYDDDDRDDD